MKTRLIPALGDAATAQLHRTLVERTLRTAIAASAGPVELWCAPDIHDAFFADCARRFGVDLRDQGEGDLGTRMARALESSVAKGGPALLIGCDCPALTAEYLRQAAAACRAENDAVFGPAEDGGYVLIGLSRRPALQLFENMAWGTAAVMQETRGRLSRLGWRWTELATLWDLDRPEDLARWQRLRELG